MSASKINVLDYGSVELLNHTREGDLLVVNAARCSFDKEHIDFDYEKDTKLINYLAREKHLLPFRHPVATLRINCPIFVLRQLGKHQVGFSWSEVSRRYVTGTPTHYSPDPDQLRQAADNVKQGSSEKPVLPYMGQELCEEMEELYDLADFVYTKMLEEGVCPEQARMVLPQAMYTTTVVTGTLLGWHHLWKLRTEKHTQQETQQFAHAVGGIMHELFPESWSALCEHSS
jgi:thymidylate synthase (FAD)